MKKGIILVLSTAFISGVSIYLNKFAVSGLNPQVFTTLKNLCVGLAFAALIILFKEYRALKSLKLKDWFKLFLVGLIGGSIPFLLFFQGLSLTSAAKAGFIHKTLFIYVAIFAFLFLKERLDKKAWLGVVSLIIANILFLKIKPQPLQIGDLLVFLAALMWAGEITISKKLLNNLSPKIVILGRMGFGSLIMIGYLIFTNKASLIFNLNLNQWWWVIFTSGLLFGYVFTFYNGLKYLPATLATAILSLGAPITLLLQIGFSEKNISFIELFGLGIIIISLLIISGIKFKNFQLWKTQLIKK